MKRFAATILCAVPVIAFSATFNVVEKNGITSGATLTSPGVSGCVYANQHVALGDVLNYPDGTKQVCASGNRGPHFIDVVQGT
ncbi:hypothetical protein PQQ84_35995 [Paraburkholderia strydomiana]|jgi:hypothetical protein|uniref:hypothetical protein n=1 Tax=Paraburkholderia strydomiana TaxID=1245417 RepID=UPI0038B7742B